MSSSVNNWKGLRYVMAVTFFDSVFPLHCFNLTVEPIKRSLSERSSQLWEIRKASKKSTHPSSGKIFGAKTTTCITFSNGAPIQHYKTGTVKFDKCKRKVKTEGRISLFLLIFTPFKFYNNCFGFIENEKKVHLSSDSTTFEQSHWAKCDTLSFWNTVS